MIKYFTSKTDKSGYVYSVDNCVFEYSLKNPNQKDSFLEYLKNLAIIHNLENEYWERRNLKPCSHWAWCSDVVHLCNGIYLSIGKWNYADKNNPVYVPRVVLEINLNKHGDKSIYSDLNQYLIDYCISCNLKKFDFAIDIPAKLKDVEVFCSRKEKGLYKGTKYFGQRNKHGYCKVYDKSKERGIEEEVDITRVEHTLFYGKKYSLETVHIKTNEFKDQKISTTENYILQTYYALGEAGLDSDQFLNLLTMKKKRQIKELINGSGYKKLEYDLDLLKDMLEEIKSLTGFKEKVDPVWEDPEGWLHINDNYILPFE